MADEALGTEDQILDNMGEGNKDGQTDDNDNSGSETSGTTADDIISSITQGAADKESGKGSDNKSTDQQTRGPEDLVDASGRVIARGGMERRHYETAQKERTRASTAEASLKEANAALEAVKSSGDIGTRLGLTPEEVMSGAQLLKSFRDDPVGTLKYMLTQAQASGHNIDNIGSAGTDMEAMKSMMETMLKPLTDERQERIDTQNVTNESQQVYDNFMTRYPDAAVHQGSIAQLLENDSNLTPDAAYYKLQAFYATKGLDWKVPLETLRKTADEAAKKVDGKGGTQATLPSGGNTSENSVTDADEAVSVDTSTDEIIRQAMKEAGITKQ